MDAYLSDFELHLAGVLFYQTSWREQRRTSREVCRCISANVPDRSDRCQHEGSHVQERDLMRSTAKGFVMVQACDEVR